MKILKNTTKNLRKTSVKPTKFELPPILIGVFRGLRVVFSARDLVFRVLRRRNKFSTVWRGVSRLHKSSFGFFVKISVLAKEMVRTLGEWTFLKEHPQKVGDGKVKDFPK